MFSKISIGPLVISVAILLGCTSEPSKDSESKRQLVGTWGYDFQDTHGRKVSGIQTFRADGSFVLIESTEHEPEVERSEGEWFVTEALLKLKTTRLDGKKLGTMQTVFFTCKLLQILQDSFSCRDEIASQVLIFKRQSSSD